MTAPLVRRCVLRRSDTASREPQAGRAGQQSWRDDRDFDTIAAGDDACGDGRGGVTVVGHRGRGGGRGWISLARSRRRLSASGFEFVLAGVISDGYPDDAMSQTDGRVEVRGRRRGGLAVWGRGTFDRVAGWWVASSNSWLK